MKLKWSTWKVAVNRLWIPVVVPARAPSLYLVPANGLKFSQWICPKCVQTSAFHLFALCMRLQRPSGVLVVPYSSWATRILSYLVSCRFRSDMDYMVCSWPLRLCDYFAVFPNNCNWTSAHSVWRVDVRDLELNQNKSVHHHRATLHCYTSHKRWNELNLCLCWQWRWAKTEAICFKWRQNDGDGWARSEVDDASNNNSITAAVAIAVEQPEQWQNRKKSPRHSGL